MAAFNLMNYVKSKNTYFAKPKDDSEDKVEAIIGDDKQSVRFFDSHK